MIYLMQPCAAVLHLSPVLVFLQALGAESSTDASVCRELLLSMRSPSSLSVWFCGRVWRLIRLNELLSRAATQPPTPTDTYTSSCESMGCGQSPLTGGARLCFIIGNVLHAALSFVFALFFFFRVPPSLLFSCRPRAARPQLPIQPHTLTHAHVIKGAAVAPRALASNAAGGNKRRRRPSAASALRVCPACALSCVELGHWTCRRCSSSAFDRSPAWTRLRRRSLLHHPPLHLTACFLHPPLAGRVF